MRKLALLAASVLVLTGCSAEPEETIAPTPTATQSPTPTPTEEPEPEPILVAAPLTGVLYEEGTNSL
ncbi:MAG: glycoside hydrolase family 3 protein, partial [Aquiluna sp.]